MYKISSPFNVLYNPIISPIQPIKCVLCQPVILPRSPILQESKPLTFPTVNVISFSPLDQQLLRFSPLLDHVTEITCHLFKSVQFDFDDGNLISGLIELQSVSWILAEFYFNRGLQRLYTGTCIILQETINGFLCLLIVFLKSKTYQLILKDLIKLNRNLR